MATGTIAKEVEFLSPLAAGALLFRRMNLHEALGRMPSCVVELVRPSADSKITASQLLGQKATVKLLDLKETRDELRGAVRIAEVTVEVNGKKVSLVSGDYLLANAAERQSSIRSATGAVLLIRGELRPTLGPVGLLS